MRYGRSTTAPKQGATRTWIDVLGDATRPEFRSDVYLPARGEPILFGRVCAVTARGAATHVPSGPVSGTCA